jgi:biopolymer transport protein TolR
MAFQINKKNGPISEINVTPLVDVMLVLLVIFMITAPLMLNGINLELPKTKEVNQVSLTTSQVVLSLTRAGDIYLGKDKILKEEMLERIKQEFISSKTDIVYLRADFGIKYGSVAKMMSQLKGGGIVKIALITETEE